MVDWVCALTFCNHRGESAIDCVLCNKCSLYKILDFSIHSINCVSDHKIVSFSLKMNMCFKQDDVEENLKTQKHVKWKESKKDDYISRMVSDEFSERMNALKIRIEADINKNSLEACIVELSDILVTAGSGHVFVKNRNKNNEKK